MPAKFWKSALALIVLCIAQSAFAVSLNPRGLGQVLIYPYYTVNKNQDTLISVGNASVVGKAVQVRLAEGYNGRDALTFMLYLSPFDIWTASISQVADNNGAAIKTSDKSCTDPSFPAIAVPLHSSGYDGTGAVPADGGPQSITRTREGFIEIIERGDIDPGSQLATITTHVQNGSPGGGTPACGVTDVIAAAGIVAPTGGLFGSGSIINVGEGTFFAYNADALQGFSSTTLYSPGSTEVSLADANSSESADGGAVAYIVNEQGQPLALDYQFGIDAVSAVFMADTVYNEYIVGGTLGASTDWVLTFPTKQFYVDFLYGAVPIAPFVYAFAASGVSDVEVSGDIYDREEGRTTFGGSCIFCPPVSPVAALSYQVNVVPIQNPVTPNAVSGVFGSSLDSLTIPPFGNDGHIAIDLASGDDNAHVLPGGLNFDGAGVTLQGLPVTGFMAYNVINANAQPGMLANYSGAFAHRTTMRCEAGSASGCDSIISGANAGARK